MSVVLAPELVGAELRSALADPQRLLDAPQSRFVKDHRRTAVAAARVGGREVFVKRFKPYAWYRRLEWWLTGTPARRCWRRSAELERAGFRVAPALAFVETRAFGLPADGYFVTAAIDGALPAGRWWRERACRLPLAARSHALSALAAELRRLHDAGFYTRDANADNFLVRDDGEGRAEVFLLDLENVRRLGRVDARRRDKNLVQLHGPVRGEVRRLDRLRFLRAYFARPLHGLAQRLRRLADLDARKEAEYRARRRAR